MNLKTISHFFILISCLSFSQKISSGKIERIEKFTSKFIEARNIDVWLPENYNTNNKYAVVYMHDGQMLFDAQTTWNKQEWKVDETVESLLKENKIENCIVVAIWNNGENRISEYFPTKLWKDLSPELQQKLEKNYKVSPFGKTGADSYLKFITEELKPEIDKKYSTFTDKDHTFMIGSSMGGIISLYAISEYPSVFGGVACMSSAWLSQIEPNFEIPLALFSYLKTNLASSLGHKIYMDFGTKEADENYTLTQNFIILLMKNKGYSDTNLQVDKIEGGEHNEVAWANRLANPVTFLLGKKQNQKVISGTLDLYEKFKSKYVTERNVEVWLPENYDGKKKFAVLYMHDGQMLFDATTSWNKTSWEVDDVASKMMKEGKLKDFIVVGISNGGSTRHSDYFPQKPFESLTQEQKDFVTKKLQETGRTKDIFQPKSDNYLTFLVSELKPFIDKKYSVRTDKANTFIMGSSMGGLISMYAITQFPTIFGGAACLSTHWPGIFTDKDNPIPNVFYQYLEKNISKIKSNKIYFDYGDQTLDAMYPPLQAEVDKIMLKNGFTTKNWKTEFFKGENHSETAWNNRLEVPLAFLLGK